MRNSLFRQDVKTVTENSTIGSLLYHYAEGSVYFDESYQRQYVWTTVEQQQLLNTIFSNLPLDSLSVVIDEDSDDKYMEIVDGRQRTTTIIKYKNNEFPYIDKHGNEIFYRDLSSLDEKEFRSIKLPLVALYSTTGGKITKKEKLEFFYRKNFFGVPQSSEHKAKIEQLILSENEK